MEKSKALTYTRVLYLLYSGAVGHILPYSSLYDHRIGLSGLQLGILARIPALVVPLASPLWRIVADSLYVHRALLSLAAAGTMMPALLLSASAAMIWWG